MFTFLTRECAADESERRVDRTPQCHPYRQCRTIPSEMHSNFAEISLKLRLKRPGTVRHTSGNGPASKLRSKTSDMVRHTHLAMPNAELFFSKISSNFAEISLSCSKFNIQHGPASPVTVRHHSASSVMAARIFRALSTLL